MALLISAIFCLLLIGLTASYFRRAHQGREALKRMENLAAEKNGRCLSEKYVNASTKLKWECEKDIHGRQRQIQFYEEGGAPPVTVLSVSLLRK